MGLGPHVSEVEDGRQGNDEGIGQWLTGEDGFDGDGGRPAPEKKRLIFLLASSILVVLGAFWRGARGANDGETAWPGLLHGGQNTEVAMAAVLGACSRAPVARSRSDAVTARNGVGLGGMEMALKGHDGTGKR
uniref:DUF834 domain-containing protein n=1 Tax=Oryza meridionalis TaxID=40149 RepID=A0A0E0E0U5_9ORYZ